MPKALDVNWDLIRAEFSHGAQLRQLAEKHGVKFGTLAARCNRETWMQTRPETHANSMHTTMVQAAKSQGYSLAEAGQAYATRTFAKFSKLVDDSNLPAPKTFRDVEVADKIARRSAGLENIETQVNTVIGIGDMSSEPDCGPVIGAEIVGDSSSEESGPE
jgi:glutamate synthase domain-containing protein 2